MKALVNWLDDRTGIRGLVHEALYERVPGGARWRYVWGSTLVFAFMTQAITGTFLWMSYSPSSQTAWESVNYIQHEMTFGWLLRGIHHYMSGAMIVLLVLHLMQVIIDGAYRAPREVNFWLGLILMQIVLALSLTGYLLPWDQKGYWATRVATNLMGIVPYIGGDLQTLVVGGSDYGHHTLTRFFALHAGVLPALLVGFLVLHVAIFRRHGLHAKNPTAAPDTTFWPDQVLKDSVACLAVLCAVLFLVFRPAIFGAPIGAHLGDLLGAELDAPADAANAYAAARPEWYFLFLFQFLKYFPGESEIYGAIVIPGALMGVLALMPLVGRWRLGHAFNVMYLLIVLCGAGFLTAQAWYDDHIAGLPYRLGLAGEEAQLKESQAFLDAVELAEKNAHRARQLVRGPGGIPPTGAVTLLRDDPLSEGPRLFAAHCASCHAHIDDRGQGVKASEPSAPNLSGFAGRTWLAGLLDAKKIVGPGYFGLTAHRDGDMAKFVRDDFKATPEQLEQLIAALSAEAQLPLQAERDRQEVAKIAAGKPLLEKLGCTDCHRFGEQGEIGSAPDLTGYGSEGWLTAFIAAPGHERFYGDHNDRMPAFASEPDPAKNKLSPRELRILVRWLRGDWYRANDH